MNLTPLALVALAALPSSARIDPRFGHLLDNDPRLKADGRVSQRLGRSALCGPATFENALTKIRRVVGLPPVDPIADLEKLVPRDSPIIENGVGPAELQDMIVRKFRELHIEADVVDVRIGPEFDLGVLRDALRNDTVVLVLMDWWPNSVFKPSDPWSVPHETGHWIASSGFDLNDPNLFYFQDPLHVEPAAVEIKPGFPVTRRSGERYLNEIVNYRTSPPYEPNHTVLVRHYLKINLR